jgi:hypothetical protein
MYIESTGGKFPLQTKKQSVFQIESGLNRMLFREKDRSDQLAVAEQILDKEQGPLLPLLCFEMTTGIQKIIILNVRFIVKKRC